MDKLIPVLVLIFVIVAGFVIKLLELRNINKRVDFTNGYRNKFSEFVNVLFSKKSFDQKLYYELTFDVNAMQRELGADGIMAHAFDSLKGFSTSNYPLLINFLPELKDVLGESDNPMMIRYLHSASECDDMFIRHLGSLNDYANNVRKNLLNPFSCFSEGIKSVVALPVMILNWIGVLSDEHTEKIKRSWIVSFINFAAVILGLVGSIVTIVLGWQQFLQMVCNFISTF